MLYCPKCQMLSTDSETCPSCGGKRLREPQAEDPVLLITADETKTEMIEAVFEDNNLPYEERISGLGGPPSVIFGKSTNTNKNIFVSYGELEAATALLNGIGILDSSDMPEQGLGEKENRDRDNISTNDENDGEHSPEELSSRKRTFLRIVSVILFILAVWGVVTVSDYAANGLKGFFSNMK